MSVLTTQKNVSLVVYSWTWQGDPVSEVAFEAAEVKHAEADEERHQPPGQYYG